MKKRLIPMMILFAASHLCAVEPTFKNQCKIMLWYLELMNEEKEIIDAIKNGDAAAVKKKSE